MFPPEYKAGIACSIACVGILDSEWTLATWTEWVWSLCCIQLSVHSRTCLGRMSVGPQTSKIMQSWTKVLQNVLAFLAGLFLNRTSPATPGPTQLWTSVTVFPVVCGFFFLGGGGGWRELRYFSKWLHFFMMQPRGRPTDHCEYRTTVLFQGPSRDVVPYTAIITCLIIQGSSQEKRRRQRWLTKHWEGLRARETSGMPADDC